MDDFTHGRQGGTMNDFIHGRHIGRETNKEQLAQQNVRCHTLLLFAGKEWKF